MPSAEPAERNAPVIWAQRKDVVFVTLNVEDCKDPEIDVTDTHLKFKGHKLSENVLYHADLEFYGEVDAAKARRNPSDRCIQYVLPKKEIGPYWPRLLKPTGKPQWLKVDFAKWKDEDESDDEMGAGGGGMGGGDNFEEMMRNMGGMGGMNMGGMDGPPDLGDFDDSDDEGMPDLEDEPGGAKPEESAAGDVPKKAEDEEDTEGAPKAATATTTAGPDEPTGNGVPDGTATS